MKKKYKKKTTFERKTKIKTLNLAHVMNQPDFTRPVIILTGLINLNRSSDQIKSTYQAGFLD